MAEILVYRKCDVAKWITIRSAFLAKAGYSSFWNPENCRISWNKHSFQGIITGKVNITTSCLIRVKQWSPHFLSKGHINCYAIFRGPDTLHNVIVLVYVTFCKINKFLWRYIFFIIDKMSSRAGFGPWVVVWRPLEQKTMG